MGLGILREKIAGHYRRVYGVDVDPSRILVTPGTSIAFMVAYQLLLDAGKRIAMPDPGYPCYKNFAHMVDAEPVFLPVGPETGYRLSTGILDEYDFDVLHVSSPSNPTGTVCSAGEMEVIVSYCRERKAGLVSDELYHGLVYEGRAVTALEYTDDAIVINGFSKYFCMPGMRIGWMIVPERFVRPAEIIAQNLYIAAPTLSQYAAVEAFDYDYLAGVRETFRRRRDFLYGELNGIFGIDAKPEGAFYLWCDISQYSRDAAAFSEKLLESVHIAVTPGIDFGANGTGSHLRFAYTREIPHLAEGVERLRRFLG
jgi:aspartate/methionine/tyrosine aminotransferase